MNPEIYLPVFVASTRWHSRRTGNRGLTLSVGSTEALPGGQRQGLCPNVQTVGKSPSVESPTEEDRGWKSHETG